MVPWGCGTQMHLGPPPADYDVALSLQHLNRVLAYDSANLTLTAEAGLALREAYRLTVADRQFLPLGYPGSAASLGGLLATNTSGVKRLRYGGMRDLLLGIRVALPEGELLRYGGRVVKNVAGYDLCKLYIGSLGAFGVVTEATFRLVDAAGGGAPAGCRVCDAGAGHGRGHRGAPRGAAAVYRCAGVGGGVGGCGDRQPAIGAGRAAGARGRVARIGAAPDRRG